MSLKPPSLWIEKRGRQFRVYCRDTPGRGLPARSYERLYSRGDAEQFISMAAFLLSSPCRCGTCRRQLRVVCRL